jgi:hypothetical protein
METVTGSNSRVRINTSITAKGQVQWDITSEFETLDAAKANLSKAIDEVRGLIQEKGLVEAHA